MWKSWEDIKEKLPKYSKVVENHEFTGLGSPQYQRTEEKHHQGVFY